MWENVSKKGRRGRGVEWKGFFWDFVVGGGNGDEKLGENGIGVIQIFTIYHTHIHISIYCIHIIYNYHVHVYLFFIFLD